MAIISIISDKMNYIHYGNYINIFLIIISISDIAFKSLIYGSCSRRWSLTDFWRGRATASSLTNSSNAAGPSSALSIAASSNPSACHGAASSSVHSKYCQWHSWSDTASAMTDTGSKSFDCALVSTMETYDDPENGNYLDYTYYCNYCNYCK